MKDSHLFLVCPNCSLKKELTEEHLLTAIRYKFTSFVVLCKCGTPWDIQTGKLNPVPDEVLKQIKKYSEIQKLRKREQNG